MTSHAGKLFRPQAVDFQRRGRLRGDVLRITSDSLRAVFWFVVAGVLLGVAFLCTAQVQRYSSGPGVIAIDQRHEISAERAGIVAEIAVQLGQHVQQGDELMRLHTPAESAELASIEREIDDQLVLLMQKSEQRSASDALSSLRARQAVARTALERGVVRAPAAGQIVDLRARVAQHVEVGAALLALQGEHAGAELTALLPGPDRPRLHVGMPLQVRIAGFERSHLELLVDRIDEQVLGPREAVRAVGSELADAFELSGPIVLVHARLRSAELFSQGLAYRLHHGMPATVEVVVEREPLLFACVPGLREALGDVF
jgi:membrane fusion protein, multidrug efflux system